MYILFLTSRLSLGGAETHIVGLAKSLTAMGHTVTIASAGGRLVEALPPTVAHITMPLDRKDPLSLLRSLTALWRLLKSQKIPLVHAHARIPAVIAALLQKFLPFRFVTTAHLDFPRKRWGRFSHWGERTLAVSQDIKDHLIHHYRLSPDNIAVTVNGIDTEQFCPVAHPAGMRLLHVSRLDEDRSLTAFYLIAVAGELKRRFPDFSLTILGVGRHLTALRRAARETDPTACFLTVVGGVSDPAPYLQAADLFVGVSRAALEAMSCGLPVILSGNQGYGGILTPEALPTVTDTNLCCRGEPLPTENRLLEDITVLLGDRSRRAALGAFGRETVLRSFPFHRTAADCLSLYQSLPPRPSKKRNGILLGGYFGYNNTGDEAILTASLGALRQEDPLRPITVLAAHPRRIARDHGVQAVGRWRPWGIIRELIRCDTLLFGGGGLLQDESSPLSLLYYTTLLRLGRLFRCRIALQAAGIGPLKRPFSHRLVVNALRGATISVRDPASRQRLVALGITATISAAPDPALSLSPAPSDRIAHLLRRHRLTSKQFVILAPRKEAPAVFSLPIGMTPVLIPFFPAEDRACCLSLRDKLPRAVLLEGLSPSEILGVVGASALVLGMRLHAILFAQRMGVPHMTVGENPKLTEYKPWNPPRLETQRP